MSDRLDDFDFMIDEVIDFSQYYDQYPLLDEVIDFSQSYDEYPLIDGWDSQTPIEHSGNNSSAPSSSQQSAPERHRTWRRVHKLSNQLIKNTLCPQHECLTTADFLSNHDAIVSYEDILISKMYYGSYIWEETLCELGFEPTRALMRRTLNPRGRSFNPIGMFSLYIWLNGPDPIPPIQVDFYVLPGSPAEAGVHFILGNPDIKRIWGDEWTPQQHVERLSRVEMGSFTFGPA
jgi:hypothetical protein